MSPCPPAIVMPSWSRRVLVIFPVSIPSGPFTAVSALAGAFGANSSRPSAVTPARVAAARRAWRSKIPGSVSSFIMASASRRPMISEIAGVQAV